MRTLSIPIDSDSTAEEPHGMTFDHRFSCIAIIKNEWSSQSMLVLKYGLFSFFSSVGLVNFLFCFFCLRLFIFHKLMAPMGEMNKKYRTARVFGIKLSVFGVFRYSKYRRCYRYRLLQISDIGSVFSVHDPWLVHTYENKTIRYGTTLALRQPSFLNSSTLSNIYWVFEYKTKPEVDDNYAHTLCRRITKFDVVTHMGRGLFRDGQPHPHPKGV